MTTHEHLAQAAQHADDARDDQVQAAIDRGGLVDPQQQAERTAYLAQIAAGLPADLAQLITGASPCPSSE